MATLILSDIIDRFEAVLEASPLLFKAELETF